MQKQEQNQEKRDGVLQQPKNQAQLMMTNPSPSPPSSSSSPSHEFSFTISLHPSSAATAKTKSTTTSPPFAAAIDLSPADEIFFHGHLLPLHLLSHFPVSPRSSTNSLDSFTLPIKESSQNNNNSSSNGSDDQFINIDHNHPISQESSLLERKAGQKSKSFSLFGFPRWRKAREKEYDCQDEAAQKRNKSKFDLSHVIKRYMRLIKPFISLRNSRRSENSDDNSQRKPAFSYSGNLKVRSKKEYNFMRGKREFSAPASMSTSPTNSGLLVASGSLTPNSTSDSTMEELQAAIQAAIAHCKKSIATEDKNQAAGTT